MLSSKSDAKAEGRLAARIDVLTERVDMLATTLATTASAIAKKDGEIAALQRAFEERDQTLRALVEHANRAAQTAPADAPIDESELRSLRNAVAALTKERAGGVNAAQIERLVATVRALAERVDALAAAVAAPAEPTPDLELTARVDAVTADLAVVRTVLESPPEELVSALAEVRERVEDLAERGVTGEQLDERLTDARADVRRELTEKTASLGSFAQRLDRLDSRVESGTASLTDKEQRLRALERQVADSSSRIDSIAADLTTVHAGVTQQLDERLEETRAGLDALTHRMDELASGLESAATSHADEEQRLEVLNRQLSESSARIESIADDFREALGAFPEANPDQLGELSGRIDLVEKRVATVAVEVARAKTLWPVALRSLEARLDDVAPKSVHHEPRADDVVQESAEEAERPEETTDDLLAGLRDSLQAMESVAAELERSTEATPQDAAEDQTHSQQAVAGGARVVPLRTTDP